jgi:quinol---cytochrome c reductase iron-sulfur subunit, bacillus type
VEQENQSQVTVPSGTASRRSFLGVLLGLGTAGVGLLLAAPVMRFIFYPLSAKTRDSDWAEVGPVSDFANIKIPMRRTLDLVQRDGWRKIVNTQVVYIDNKVDGSLTALSSICPHLGCAASWRDSEEKFMCPCHGGVFARNGSCVSGPPPRAMDALETKVVDGKLMVRYQYFRPNTPNRQVTS